MGRCEYSEIGFGFDENEARQDAIEKARQYAGHQDGYAGTIASSTGEEDKVKCLVKPKAGKRCTVEKQVNKGTRKWKTVYVLEYYGQRLSTSSLVTEGTQAEAIKKAKELALKNQCMVNVRIVKVLETGNAHIATVKPAKSEKGKWLFTGLARE